MLEPFWKPWRHSYQVFPLALALAMGARGTAADTSAIYGWGDTTLPDNDVSVVQSISAGSGFTVAVLPNGSLAAWGLTSAQVTPPPSGTDFTAVSAGNFHALALRTDGSIASWGVITGGSPPAGTGYTAIAAGNSFSVALKSDGSIALTGTGATGILKPPTGTDFTAIAAGDSFVLALKTDGSIVAWGQNASGQLSVPAGTGFTAIAAGWGFALAIAQDGSIVAWGDDLNGQVTNVPTGTGFKAIAAGQFHGAAIAADGSLVAWGANYADQATPPSGTGFISLSAYGDHTIAHRADGTWAGWGANNYAQANPPPFTGIASISAGAEHDLALLEDGSIAAWGRNDFQQAVAPAGNDFIAVAAGGYHSLALKADHSIVGWGNNYSGEATPPDGNEFAAIAAGGSFEFNPPRGYSLALKTDGSIVGWGDNSNDLTTPPAGNDFKAIAAGPYHALALKNDGSIVGWGRDDSGQATPPPGNDYVAIAAGQDSSMALKADGTVVSWGSITTAPAGTGYTAVAAGDGFGLALNAAGAIVAVNDTHGTYTPPTGGGFTAVAANHYHALALRTVGAVVDPLPSVAVTDPIANDVFDLGEAIDITAVLSGDTSAVIRVEFYADNNLLGQVAAAPYTYGWTSAPAGVHNLKAQAVTIHNQSAASTAVEITVADPRAGQLEITSPDDRAIFPVGSPIDLVASFHGDPSIVTRVEFVDGSTLLGQSTSFPFSYHWTDATAGVHALGARAILNANQPRVYARSAVVLVGDGPFPEVAIVTPHDGAKTSPGGGVFIQAVFTGDASQVDRFELFDGSTYLSRYLVPPGETELLPFFQRDFASEGSHLFTVQAHHVDGHTTSSNAVSFDVVWDPRAPILTSPGFASLFVVSDPLEPVDVDLEVQFCDQTTPVLPGTEPCNSPPPAGFEHVEFQADLEGIQGPVSSPPYKVVERAYYADAVDENGIHYVKAHGITPVAYYNGQAIQGLGSKFWVLNGLKDYFDCIIEFLKDVNSPSSSASNATGRNPRSGRTAAAQVATLDFDLFRQFRDEFLETTPAGQYYADLYKRTSPLLIQAMTRNEALVGGSFQALLEWTPAIQALVDGHGDTAQITPDMAIHAQNLLAALRDVAPPELATIMDSETTALDPATWSGMTIDDLLGRVEAQVRPAPSIKTQPLAQTVTAGGALTLTVAADGAGPFTYQWYRNGTAIAGATSESYSIASAQRFDAGDYTVKVGNPFGDTTSDIASFAVAAPAVNTARLLNLSTRAETLTGDNILIPGFVVSGTGTKKLLIRAVGPTLSHAPFNIATALDNPRMTLKRLDFSQNPAAYVDVDANDDWMTNANSAAISQAISDLYAFPFEDDRESALLVDLAPGQYTVFADGVNLATGVAIVELYDADAPNPTAKLINISNRGFCGVGSEVMIPGFVVSSEGPKTLLIRVVGPTLAGAPFNVPGTMTDPKLEIFPAGSGTPILTQDNWGDPATSGDAAYTAQVASDVSAFALANGSADAAFVVTLAPGSYTVVGSAADGTSTGIVLVEVYVVP